MFNSSIGDKGNMFFRHDQIKDDVKFGCIGEKSNFAATNLNHNNMNAIAMNNLWNYLQGLSMTANNRKWLAERLVEPTTSEVMSDDEIREGLRLLAQSHR